MKYLIKETKITEEELNSEIEFATLEKQRLTDKLAEVDKQLEELVTSKSKLKEE